MFVDRKKIRYSTDQTGFTIDIPLKLEFTPTDSSELVQEKFVDDEVIKSINPITDYKKVRFKPARVTNNNWEVIDEFKIKLNFFTKDSISAGTPTYGTGVYGDIGFSSTDLFCRSSRVINSYLSFNFYDSPNPSSNNLITFSNIFTQIFLDQKDAYGIPLPASENPISYRLGDTTLKPDSVHEGFHLYWFEDLVKGAPNNEYVMYLSPTYNNANNGEVSIMYPTQTTIDGNGKADISLTDISGPEGTLYIKVKLKYDTTDKLFKYTFMENDSNGVANGQLSADGGGLDLYNSAVPTITLWQLAPNGTI